MRDRLWIGVWLVLAGCHPGGGAKEPVAADRCSDVVTGAVDRAYGPGGPSVEVVKAVKIRRCHVDGWSDAALACYAAAGSIGALLDCRGKMLGAQANALESQERQIRDDWEQLIAEHESVRDKMCGCADRACAAEVAHKAKPRDGSRHPVEHTSGREDVDERVHKADADMHACQKKLGGSAMDMAMAKMNEFGDAMCQCKDSACAQHVSDEMTKWGQEESRSHDWDDFKPTEEDAKKMADITKRMTDCMTKAMGAGTP